MNNNQDKMEYEEIGDLYHLKRKQWGNKEAYITKDPELLEEVLKYTWTDTKEEHPYLQCSKLKTTLHKFVLSFLYGEEYVQLMLDEKNIIEHLDNNGFNCAYENLHILSEDWNKAKAFSIDKMNEEKIVFPQYCTDVYYDHNDRVFQMQIVMTEDLYINDDTGVSLERFVCRYKEFKNLFIDWIYLLDSKDKGFFEIEKFHANKIYFKERPQLHLPLEEQERPFIIRDGKLYLNLNAKTKDGRRCTSILHTPFQKIDDIEEK